MKCPSCKSELIVTGQEYLETSADHVFCNTPSLKDSYICSNPDCKTHTAGVRWNQFGELYSRSFLLNRNIKYIDNNSGPFGSYERKINVEIWKHNEDFTALRLFGWRFKIEFKYKSDEDGNILKRSWKLVVIKPDNTVYISGISMFFFIVDKSRHFDWKNENSPLENGKEWWRYASNWFVKLFQPDRYEVWQNNGR